MNHDADDITSLHDHHGLNGAGNETTGQDEAQEASVVQMATRRRQRRDEAGELLDWLMELSDDPRHRFIRLHERPTGITRSLYPIPEALALYLDSGAQQGRAHRADMVLAARAALRRERRDLSEVVEACCFARPTMKQQVMAERLGVSQPIVSKRVRHGLRWLQTWCLTEMSTSRGA